MSSAVVGLVRCLTLVLMLLPCAAIADEKGDLLLEQADSLYGAQQYKEALEAAHEALPLTKGTESEADCLNLLAITNIRLSDYEEAARYAKECYAIDEQALRYIERAYEIDKQLGNEPRAMVRLAQKASVLVGKHEYEEAESTLKQVIPYLRQMQDRHSLGIALSKLGMAVLSQDREVEATPYFQEAIKIFQELGDPYNEVQAHRGLYECLWKHDPAEARRCLKRFSDLKDSLYNNMSAEALAKYNAEFGNDWLQIENKEERREKWWAIGLAVTVGIIGVCVWWLMRYRHKRQARINKELSEHIRELNRKYDILSEHYENAITTSAKRDESMELTTSDREFLERTVNTIYQLIQEGRPDAVHLAAQMGMSLYQLRQRLDSVTGEKPQDFIATVRMRRARHLLDTHPELNISEIATLCAYNDTPNFTRAFKKTFGLTPTNYLERQKDADTENK